MGKFEDDFRRDLDGIYTKTSEFERKTAILRKIKFLLRTIAFYKKFLYIMDNGGDVAA